MNMENYILYYYNLNIKNVVKLDNCYYFTSDSDTFYFCKTEYGEKELEKLNENVMVNTKYHLMIRNRFYKFLSSYEDSSYVLVRINTLLNDYVLFDDLLYGNKIRMDKPMVEWPRIWQAKIDYMEKQMKELGVGKEVLIHSFSYYIGLGENAISYYNYNKPVSKNISMCHFRMNNPILPVNYYHPLSLILDYDVRDYAEYFKVSFFNEMLDMKEVSKFIFDNRYDYNDMILFYSRMLYPTYYFDLFERSITDNVLEKRIMDVITKSDKYEMLLKDIYYEIRKKYNIPGVDWLIKKSN